MTDIKDDYVSKMEERTALAEEEKFQKKVEMEYERIAAAETALEASEAQLEKYTKRAPTLTFNDSKKKNAA